MARRRFFVNEVRNGVAAIAGEEAAHLTRVLRVEQGQKFEISDNQRVWLAEVTSARKSLVEFAVLEDVEPGSQLYPIHLYAALFKFDRFEWMVEKVTELGIERIIPVETDRSEHGLFAAANKRAERWRRIAKEASQQSRRTRVPEIAVPVRLRSLTPSGSRIFLDELPGTPPLQISEDWRSDQPLAILLGPEGGWTEEERSTLLEGGWQSASLGPTVLRAETAAIAAVAVAVNEWSRRESRAPLN
jgi:16S rRNA (uracil1498-N3)-methyltransferase